MVPAHLKPIVRLETPVSLSLSPLAARWPVFSVVRGSEAAKGFITVILIDGCSFCRYVGYLIAFKSRRCTAKISLFLAFQLPLLARDLSLSPRASSIPHSDKCVNESRVKAIPTRCYYRIISLPDLSGFFRNQLNF